jgi:hypothetical protein
MTHYHLPAIIAYNRLFSDETTGETEYGYEIAVTTAVATTVTDQQMSVCCRCI